MKFNCKKKIDCVIWHPEMWHAAQRKKTHCLKNIAITFHSAICVYCRHNISLHTIFSEYFGSPPPIIFVPMLHTQHFIQLLMLHNLSNWQHHYVKPLPCLSYQISSDILLLLMRDQVSHQYRTETQITFLYITFFMFSDSRYEHRWFWIVESTAWM